MVNQNPNFFNNMQNPQFQDKIQMLKMQRVNQVRSINELNINKEKLSDYVICPMKIEKGNNEDVDKEFKNISSNYQEIRENLWKQRTNQPYKNIIKDADFNKSFNSKEDLLIHKVTKADSDPKKFEKEFKNLKERLKKEDNELKNVIFTESRKEEHRKRFNYIKKFKRRVNFNPKDFSDLKKAYEQEVKSIEKRGNMITEVLDKYMDSDRFSIEDKKRIQDAYQEYQNAKIEDFDKKLLTAGNDETVKTSKSKRPPNAPNKKSNEKQNIKHDKTSDSKDSKPKKKVQVVNMKNNNSDNKETNEIQNKTTNDNIKSKPKKKVTVVNMKKNEDDKVKDDSKDTNESKKKVKVINSKE
jgi:hypothetical protein